jgi:hypothetical protein
MNMFEGILTFAVTSLLLSQITLYVAGQNNVITNFTASHNESHITFSWEMDNQFLVDNSYGSRSWYNYLYSKRDTYGNPYGTDYSYSFWSYYDGFTMDNTTFTFSMTVDTFSSYFPPEYGHIMWMRVYTSYPNYRNVYSKRIYIKQRSASESSIAVELSIKLQSSQTCSELQSATSTGQGFEYEIQRGLRKYCRQCSYDFINSIRVVATHLDCETKGYLTYRAQITSDPNASILIGVINTWLAGNNIIQIGTVQYYFSGFACSVEYNINLLTSPCGMNTSATAQGVSNTAQSITNGTSDSITAVIVASVFAAMFFILSMGLLVAFVIIVKQRRNPAKSIRDKDENPYINSTNPYVAPAPAIHQDQDQCEQIYDEMTM